MAFPTGLFVESPEFQDASMFHLSENIEEWPEELVQKLKERVPDVSGKNIITKFMKQDEENGTATGSLIVADAKKQIIVPLIIKDFMLFPLDVMVADGKLLPLTQDYFRAIFDSNHLFQKLEEYPTFGGLGRFEDANLWNATYPPSLGRYAYASGGYDILDNIADFIDGAELKNYLRNNTDVAVNLHKHGHAEVIKKIANLKPVNMNEFSQGADRLVRKPIMMLRKEGPDKYSLLSNSDKVFDPQIVRFSKYPDFYKQVAEICDNVDEAMNEVDQNGEKLLEAPKTNTVNGIEQGVNPTLEMANDFDHYVVKNKYGVEFEGMVIPRVINLGMELQPLKIFIGKTMSTIQPNIAGIRMQNSSFKLPKADPQVGQTGCFVYQQNESKALATIPFVIKSITQDCGPYQLSLVVMDLMGTGYKLKMGSDLQRIARLNNSEFMLPKQFSWVPMEGFQEVTATPVDFAAKTAARTITNTPVTVIDTGYNQYSVKGVNKYAAVMGVDPTNMHRTEVKFLLHSLGCGQEKVAALLKQAKRAGAATVYDLEFKPFKKVAGLHVHTEAAKKLKCNLAKEASYIENTQTVDALLSLNFVSPDNVSRFISKLPSFKTAISNLASCLIASRLGMQEIPESATSTAMYRLIDVVNGLEALRSTQEGQ